MRSGDISLQFEYFTIIIDILLGVSKSSVGDILDSKDPSSWYIPHPSNLVQSVNSFIS